MMNYEKVSAYFERLGLDMPEDPEPTAELMQMLHYAHVTHVPYENLDILRGVPLSMDPEDLFQKIVVNRRGGYCFELNGLFGWLLRELGYEVEDFASRYLRGEKEIPMRRHRVLRVTCNDGSQWCCDVGIGDRAARYALKMEAGVDQPQCGELYRIEQDPFLGWVVRDYFEGAWGDFYSFTEEPQLNRDFIALSAYCEYHADSPFNKMEIFSLKTDSGRITLDGHTFRYFDKAEVTEKKCTDEELPWAYAQFGLEY